VHPAGPAPQIITSKSAVIAIINNG
jgi:hypothetical protein